MKETVVVIKGRNRFERLIARGVMNEWKWEGRRLDRGLRVMEKIRNTGRRGALWGKRMSSAVTM